MPDVLVIGAGLAGLSCARALHRGGADVLVVDAADAPGGRVRTDRVDGFLLDRGFQVFLTAYPETRAALDYDALGLGTYYEGALVRYGDGFHRLADPFRRPGDVLATLVSPVGTLADKLRVAWLRLNVMMGSIEAQFTRPERTTYDALRQRWGFSDAMIDRFFRPFLGGIMLDDELEASSRMFEFVFRMFAKGPAALPRDGMGAIPAQLAAALPAGALRLGTRVTSIDGGRVTLDRGETIAAEAVVVATDGPEAVRLTGLRTPTARRSVWNLYYAADTPPVDAPILVLNGEGQGPILNLSVVSNVQPAYAPDGRALVSVSVLPRRAPGDGEGLEAAVRRQLTDWFGADAATWTHLRTYHIDYALPDQAPPFLSPPERPVRIGSGRYVCGDHRASGSINGAMRSGRHAAEAVLEDLGRG